MAEQGSMILQPRELLLSGIAVSAFVPGGTTTASANDGVATFDANEAFANGAAQQDVADFAVVFAAGGGNGVGSASVAASVAATTTAPTLAACAGRQAFTGVFPSEPQRALSGGLPSLVPPSYWGQ